MNIEEQIEEQKEQILSGFEITGSEDLMKTLQPIPTVLEDQLEDLFYLAEKGKKSSLRKFLRLVEKYPKVPVLKNYLSALYNNMGNTQKAEEVNHWIVAEHPDYLFGKLNLATEYWKKGEIDKIPEVLGEALDIKALYPKRDIFHVDEVIGFFGITVLYFAEKEDFDQAELRLEIMEELNPESNKVETIREFLMSIHLRKAAERFEKEEENRISVKEPKTISGNKTEMPNFINSEIKWLYENGLDIDLEKFEKIIALPRKTLINDLKIVLKDSKERYNYFENLAVDTEWDESLFAFLIHAFFIIGEIKASELLDDVLNILSEDEDFISFYLNDILTEYVWEILYKISENDLNKLKEFMFKPGVYTYSKSEVSKTVEQMALHQPERKQDFLNWFTDVLNFYNNAKIEDNVIDTEAIGFIVGSCIDIKYTELLPIIEELYKKQYVSHGICGSFEAVKQDISKPERFDQKKKLSTIYENYSDFALWEKEHLQDDNLEPKKSFFDNTDDEYNENYEIKPVRTEPKIGRNDPCPCGSGKKYKKCCMNKNG